MERDKAYRSAEIAIEEALRSGATELGKYGNMKYGDATPEIWGRYP